MEIISEKKEMIFRNDITYKDNSGNEVTRPIYKISLSHKNQDGSYSQSSILCKFSKNMPELESKTLIYIKKAWLDFYFKDRTKENGEKYKETIPYIFINEFTTLDDAMNVGKKDSQLEEKEINDAYQEFADEVEITADDLPF